MGVRIFLGKNYGGAKFFPVFLKTHPTGYPELKKRSVYCIFSFIKFDTISNGISKVTT